jgi:CheY-like chemotaxis protein
LDYELKDKNLKNYLESIRSSSKTLLSLIEDLLDLSKIEAGELSLKIEPVSIRGILNEVNQIFWLKMNQKKLGFIITIPESLPDILILDELRIRQILINLLSNALKFTEKGNVEVIISFKNENIVDGKVQLDLQIEVSDTGVGISKEYHELIFEAFKQQDEQDSRKYGGTGLGLSITRRLVEMMSGKITVDSKPGSGSTFCVVLPNTAINKGLSTKKDEKQNEFFGNIFMDAKILIVDDVLTNRVLLKESIKGENLTLYEATNGQEAIEMVNKYLPDLVLLDLNLPIINGFIVAEYIKEKITQKVIPIIAISATLIHDKEKGFEKYFDAFVSKPINNHILSYQMKRFLTYSKISGGDSPSKIEEPIAGKIEYDIDTKGFLVTNINQLLEEYNKVKESSSFEEIKRYASEIILFGNKHNIVLLNKIGNEIMESAENFDIEEISKFMVDIPGILNNLKIEIDG